jgi:hypothetical protein
MYLTHATNWANAALRIGISKFNDSLSTMVGIQHHLPDVEFSNVQNDWQEFAISLNEFPIINHPLIVYVLGFDRDGGTDRRLTHLLARAFPKRGDVKWHFTLATGHSLS